MSPKKHQQRQLHRHVMSAKLCVHEVKFAVNFDAVNISGLRSGYVYSVRYGHIAMHGDTSFGKRIKLYRHKSI